MSGLSRVSLSSCLTNVHRYRSSTPLLCLLVVSNLERLLVAVGGIHSYFNIKQVAADYESQEQPDDETSATHSPEDVVRLTPSPWKVGVRWLSQHDSTADFPCGACSDRKLSNRRCAATTSSHANP